MVALVHTLSSTFSRANHLLRPSSRHTTRAFVTNLRRRTQQKPTTPSSINYSSNSIRKCVSATPRFQSSTPEQPIGDDIVVLGIETSCDDTAAAVVRSNGEILSQVVSSQADLLERYGGVDPKKAGEAHSQVIDEVVQRALDEASLTEKDLSAVAVTIGPGLSLCLRVGIRKARNIAGRFMLPIVGIHHMEAHTLVARLVEKELQFPFLALLISGGHNLLVLARDLGNYVQLGTTIDDAIGEAYDKTARWLGLNMRRGGGAALEELAREGDAQSIKFSEWQLQPQLGLWPLYKSWRETWTPEEFQSQTCSRPPSTQISTSSLESGEIKQYIRDSLPPPVWSVSTVGGGHMNLGSEPDEVEWRRLLEDECWCSQCQGEQLL